MAMTIFFVLNGVGIIFLLYVLANFWKEGRQPKNPKNNDRKYAADFGDSDWTEVIAITHPVSHTAQGGLSVIPFQARRQELRHNHSRQANPCGSVEVRVKRISTR